MTKQKYPIMSETFKYFGHLSKIDKQRKEALSNQNGLKYFRLCEELGMKPEDKFLYERGYLEVIINETK